MYSRKGGSADSSQYGTNPFAVMHVYAGDLWHSSPASTNTGEKVLKVIEDHLRNVTLFECPIREPPES